MISFAFFGSDEFSEIVLDVLKKNGFEPDLIVNTKNIPEEIKEGAWDIFVVASYGKIIPQDILDIPKHGSLNVHPSLLPLYRGPSPIETVILAGEEKTGVSIMLMDNKVDHGPIIAQEEVSIPKEIYYPDLALLLAEHGGELLSRTIDPWVNGEIIAKEQDHAKTTFTKKIRTEDALIDLSADAEKNYRKVRAYLPDPKAYYLQKHNNKEIRVAITRAHIDEHGSFVIDMVLPAGKKEMPYAEFLRGIR